MKTQKMARLVMLVLGMVMVLAVEAYALEGAYICKVTAAGPVTKVNGVAITPVMQFTLTRVSGLPTWIGTKTANARVGQEKQMLATALSAMINARNVAVWFDPAVGIIYNMQLK